MTKSMTPPRGTTYCSAMPLLMTMEMPVNVKNFVGEDTTVGCFLFDEDGTVVIGSQAKQTVKATLRMPVPFIRRHGRGIPARIRGGSNLSPSLPYLEKSWSATPTVRITWISARLLSSVPAYGTQERKRLLEVTAGLKLHYAGAGLHAILCKQEQEQNPALFDLKGWYFRYDHPKSCGKVAECCCYRRQSSAWRCRLGPVPGGYILIVSRNRRALTMTMILVR